ncbi:MAG: hypothetical protein V3T17_10865 [Pseudomonadales bacterium]
MFEFTSRYYDLPIKTATINGKEIAYVGRRFLPQGETLPLATQVTVVEGDRLDLIATRSLGDPLTFWKIADANNAMHPIHLSQEPGTVLRIAAL